MRKHGKLIRVKTNNLRRVERTREIEQWSSYKERKGNALAPGADEGRSNLR